MERMMTMDEHAFCNLCGDSVAPGSGKFVNRVPDLNTPEERWRSGRPYPFGDYICDECATAPAEKEAGEGKYDYYVDMNSFTVRANTIGEAMLKADRYLKAQAYDAKNQRDAVGFIEEDYEHPHIHMTNGEGICRICGERP
jgi:hypothetical protein